MKKNDVIQLKIEKLCGNGNGIGNSECGMVIFVPRSAAGDFLSVKIIKITSNYAVGKIERIIKPSSDRIEGGCPYFSKCGGCAFQHIDYARELQYKTEMINDALRHIGKTTLKIEKMIGAPTIRAYRNKAVYPVAANDSGTMISGFYAAKSHRIIEHDACMIGHDSFTEIRDRALSFFNQKNITAYDEKTGGGIVRNLSMRKNHDGSEALLTLIVNSPMLVDDLTEKEFCAVMRETFPVLRGILINVNMRNTNVLLGDQWRLLCGDRYLYDRLCGKSFRIAPASFYQINHDQTEMIYTIAKQFAALRAGDHLLDLYCGIGTIGIVLADRGVKLTGVEIVPEAVADARYNAKRNNLDAEYICLDAHEALESPLLKNISANVIVLDPPRKGCGEKAVEAIASFGSERIVYISCDPATLARDIRVFESRGYLAQRAVGVDMFPRTGHVETVVLMSRVDK